MTETLIVSLATVLLSSISAMSLTAWRLKEIEKKLDQHNGYADKFAKMSTDMAVVKTDLNYIKQKLEKLP